MGGAWRKIAWRKICKKKSDGKNGAEAAAAYKPLSEAERAMLLANTNFSVQEIEEWHRGFLRDCPSARLNKKQFVKEYKKFYPSGQPDEFCEHVFRIFDADQNGYIGKLECLFFSEKTCHTIQNKVIKSVN
jgi:Ca2+-binding EF-hand superfamily protein